MRVGWGITLAVAASFLLASPIMAVQSGGIGAYPTGKQGSAAPWFQYHLPLGHTQADSLTIENRSSAAAHLLVYPVDASPTGDGGFGMMPQAATPLDAGSWIKLSQHTIDLDPGGSATIPFQFTVPPITSIGPHYAGIVIQPLQPPRITQMNGVTLRIVSRIGVRLYETVPGIAHPRLTADRFHHAITDRKLTVALSLHNRGNTIAVPAGYLTITNLWGRRLAKLRLNTGRSLRPGSSLSATVPTGISIGSLPYRYTAQLELRDNAVPRPHPLVYTIHFWTGSWRLAALLAMALLIPLGFLVVWRVKKIGARGSSTNPSQR